MTPEEERQLIIRLKKRDERAFARLVREFQTPVFNLTYRMLGRREEALDLSQEVFVTVFKAIGSFRGESKLSTWIYRIAVNHCRNRIKYLARRRQERHQSIQDHVRGEESLPSTDARPDAVMEGQRAQDVLREAIAALPEDQRAVLVLRDIQGMTYEEIVDATGLALGTVKSRIFRARKTVAEAYSQWKEGT